MTTDEPHAPPRIACHSDAEDAAYWQRRAEDELEMAQKASRPEVVAAHVALAEAYLERLNQKPPVPDKTVNSDEEKNND